MDTSSILIVRTSALGDVVHALPVLSALGEAFPRSKIGWVIEDIFAPLVADHPALDSVIPVRLRAWRRSWSSAAARRQARQAWRALRDFRATVAIDLMGNHKGGFLARCSGAPIRIGPAREDRREPLSFLWINRPQRLSGEHAVDRGRSLLTALDLHLGPADFAPSDCIPQLSPEATAFRQQHPTPYVLVQPGAGWANKQYPAAGWGEVVRELAEDGHEVLVLAGPGEEPLARAVVEASGDRAALAVGPPGLDFLVGILRGARLLLGGDTGPLHLAHSLKVPVVAVMGPTDPRRHGPYGSAEGVVVHPLPCSFCSKRLPETKACLQVIRPATIVAEARRRLGDSRASDNSKDIR